MKGEQIELIKTQIPFIRKVCKGFTNDPFELDELVQEVMIQLWKKMDQFRGESKITTWIYRITVNMCLYQIGKSKRISTVPFSDDQLTSKIEKEQMESRDIYNDLTEHLYSAIKLLKPIDRAIIMLYLEKKSHLEIAEIMDLTSNNVGVRINRSKKKIKEIINDGTRRHLD